MTPDLFPSPSLENSKFPGILARLEESPVCQRLPLTSFLILPFQRITRLKMLVEVPRGQSLGRAGQGGCMASSTAPSRQSWGGRGPPHLTDPVLQNILKRTAQGSEDEDMATKAFNALKEVSSAGQGLLGSQGPSHTPASL